ncbi:MAG: hypothetical protein LBU85_12070 [Treponema sp.]|jgi:hypothetical protein|nr:hypothetical protein [Treponema sp.]
MTRLVALVLFLSLVPCAVVVQAQEEEPSRVSLPSEDSSMKNLLPRFRGRAVVMDINARILENSEIIWNETHQKITIPGRPVEIKLIGENLVVVVRFTFIRNHGGGQKLLVAQGQIWMADPGQGIRYQASVQTIPLEFNEPVFYFPLGPLNPEENSPASIEVMLTLRPYEES